jgi:photosystem II stability/assembly factor-like uncharacterized protein
MRCLLVLVLSASCVAQSHLQIQNSHTTESLRGVSAVSREVAWASGTHGTYLRTVDGGRTWTAAQVPDASGLDFRAVVAFSSDEAYLMSAGAGEQSRIYHTSDGGRHWELQFTNSNPKGFFDSMAFWDPKHGIVLGDPVPDEAGKLRFELLETEDGQSWRPMPAAKLPEAMKGEGAFAASNSCIAILASGYQKHIWFATGGTVARAFHSANGGESWEAVGTPIVHGPESAGIFSIAFRNDKDGVIAGGDYKKPKVDGPNLAFTHDGGRTWELATIHPLAYFSAVSYDRKIDAEAREQRTSGLKAELKRKHIEQKRDNAERLFAVAQDFVLDARSFTRALRLATKKKPVGAFNAISALPEGGAMVVGANGVIAVIP